MKHRITILLLVYFILGIVTIIFCKGTGDVGDSVMHYLFARSAPFHPELYFDHWAKPVYVLLASPFAQFGFAGLKVFNLLTTLGTLLLIYKIANQLKLNNPVIATLLAMCSPLYFAHTFSGLTEPLFALFLALSIYFTLQNSRVSACVLLSFLPYVRSEGLIMLGVFALYFLISGYWKVLPYLLTGSIVYGIAGYFVYGNPFWVITKIPYATMSSVYGSGDVFHFVDQLYYVLGLPVTLMFWIGFFVMLIKWFRNQLEGRQGYLFLLGFLAFFIAHSLFWYLGIFNSMGLKRVLLCLMPIIAIVGLHGFNFISNLLTGLNSKFNLICTTFIVLYLILFPFTPNPAALNRQRDLELTNEQVMAKRVVSHLYRKDSLSSPLIYNHFYLSLVMDNDHCDPAKRRGLDSLQMPHLTKGTLIIWENLYAEKESGITLNWLKQRSYLEQIYTTKGPAQNMEMIFAVYKMK